MVDFMKWLEKPYHSLDYMLKERFGEKVYKLTLNGGMSCPNRDGKLGTGGCIFCSAGGSGDFAGDPAQSIDQQIAQQKELICKKRPVNTFIAYFQAYTNTYAPVEYLRALFTQALSHPEVAALSIGTRPDCLGEDVFGSSLPAQPYKTGMGGTGTSDDPSRDSTLHPPGISSLLF